MTLAIPVMDEKDVRTRAGLFGAGILLALLVVAAHLPLVLLVVPVLVFLFGIIADLEEIHATWYGMLSTLGIFDPAALTEEEQKEYSKRRSASGSGRLQHRPCSRGSSRCRSGCCWAPGEVPPPPSPARR